MKKRSWICLVCWIRLRSLGPFLGGILRRVCHFLRCCRGVVSGGGLELLGTLCFAGLLEVDVPGCCFGWGLEGGSDCAPFFGGLVVGVVWLGVWVVIGRWGFGEHFDDFEYESFHDA
jgi:hypothetical protein